MFFKNENIIFNILDVIEIKQKNVNSFNYKRNFDALSFRIHSNAHLKTQKSDYLLKDTFVTYIPSHLSYSRIADEDNLIVIHFNNINYRTENIETFLPKNSAPLINLFQEILFLWKKKETGYKYLCSAILNKILAECYSQNFTPQTHNLNIYKSIDFIENHYDDKDLSIPKIAELSFVSEVYFRKLFKKEFGFSPKKYIIRLRIQKAISLMSTGYYSLKEIADMSGYNDYTYFLVEFKKTVGVTPSEYVYNYKND